MPSLVQAIFKRCGPIIDASVISSSGAETVTVRLKFKSPDDAKAAVKAFDGKPADGQVLKVTVVGTSSTALGGRLGASVINGTVDVLMDEDPDVTGGS